MFYLIIWSCDQLANRGMAERAGGERSDGVFGSSVLAGGAEPGIIGKHQLSCCCAYHQLAAASWARSRPAGEDEQHTIQKAYCTGLYANSPMIDWSVTARTN